MIYSQFAGLQLSLLGFGTMRLPTNTDGTIEKPRSKKWSPMPSGMV